MSILLQNSAPPAVATTTATARNLPAGKALRLHWREYLMEAAGLGMFMISACLFGAAYEHPLSPLRQAIGSSAVRRVLMGISMGLTAIALIYSPWGKQSGAHLNPSTTLTFFRLGKIEKWDAFFYTLAQFAGGVAGVALMAALFGALVSHPAVRYVVTVPGGPGVWIAVAAEFAIAFGMMAAVLIFSNHDRLARLTGLFAGVLVAVYIMFEAPFSGMSMNPARTFGSALPSGVFDSLWIYFTAPPLGMLCAAELYLVWKGKQAVRCAKLHHDNPARCIFCGANGGFTE